MDTSLDFTQQLDDALTEYRGYLEADLLPKLREDFRTFYLAYEGIYKVLKTKGIVQDDPYRFEAKVAELELPDQSHFLESERDDKMAIRLSNFDAQLDFVNNYFQFSMEMLSLDRIKRLAKLTQYIQWNQLTETNPNINTKSVADYGAKIKHSGDKLSINIFKDSQEQLAKYGKIIRSHLKKLTKYHREVYKLDIRRNVTDGLNLQITQSPADAYMDQVKRKFMSAMGDKSFYAELISEVLNEDYSLERDELRSELQAELRPEQNVKPKKQLGPSFEDMLKEAIRVMSQSSRSLEICINKLIENHHLLEHQRVSLGIRFKQWFAYKILKIKREKTYEIEYIDPVTITRKTERINFIDFSETVLKKSRLYAGILGKVGTIASRLDQAGEDQLFQFLHKNLEELQIIHRRLSGLDAFFKTENPRDQRQQVRGIKNDLVTLKNNLVNANQKKHDYVAKKDELEQLKTLGVETE